jgi:CrcB protein
LRVIKPEKAQGGFAKMNFIAFWLVGFGGIIGTLIRYYLGRWIAGKAGVSFPWGTWVINLSGSLVLGFLFALHNREILSDEVWWVLGVGFCGAYTTFSTFGYELQQFMEKKQVSRAAIYLLSSMSLGLLLAWSGMIMGT